jgi:hypothetical protein
MSFNRSIYDPCAYNQRLGDSSNILTYNLDPNKHYSCKPCRVPFGLLGGNSISIQKCNLVDIESDLRSQVRLLSRCSEKKYLPPCKPDPNSQDGLPCSSAQLTCDMSDLPECDMIHYKPRINNIGYEIDYPTCPKQVACNQKQGTRMTPACQKSVRLSMAPTAQGYAEFYRF